MICSKPEWLKPFSLGCACGLAVAALAYNAQRTKLRRPVQAGSDARTPRKKSRHLPRGSLGGATGKADAAAFDREVVCEDAIVWLRGLADGLPADSSVITGIPDIHELDAGGAMSLEAYIEWFKQAVQLVLEKTPQGGRSIFMQTDVKLAQDGAHGRNAGGGAYWQWLDKSHLLMQAALQVPGTRLLWHKIIFSGKLSAGGRNGFSATYTHYLCFTKRAEPEPLDVCAMPDVLRKGLSTWTSGSGVQAVELACLYLRGRGCKKVVDPFCGEGSVLAIANELGMSALGVELSKKRAKAARTLDGKVLLETDRAERAEQ